MSGTNPSLVFTAQPLTSMLRLTQANINIDQAAASSSEGARPLLSNLHHRAHLGAIRSSTE